MGLRPASGGPPQLAAIKCDALMHLARGRDPPYSTPRPLHIRSYLGCFLKDGSQRLQLGSWWSSHIRLPCNLRRNGPEGDPVRDLTSSLDSPSGANLASCGASHFTRDPNGAHSAGALRRAGARERCGEEYTGFESERSYTILGLRGGVETPSGAVNTTGVETVWRSVHTLFTHYFMSYRRPSAIREYVLGAQ